ncbi:hypothetical protein SAICODRAFT_22383 [Saitoella complicata NRRL Y-17804]|uniref:SAYSvFN domain-containing protein n=1 Tax=Saitoella complicata (strain BCRC 22490 / CBS 7301 / JCM 7358 / NBRC 10748 / NRRL Y-17804) TaxID=698492 RepID=A0A0E9NNP6_SAICN|nr:uncharacterized protein SAICODRAFT_22383 [Saitoella complicata NRRL Y-17804]ODQ55942.1 hypothetical protein SAICODRAFT_22383 [Saitoella complicata NRRL Y-17804]GAO51497.1 hypothetical protein G7K_5596-t1 [Saitoella complicata NRRL Y-17804]
MDYDRPEISKSAIKEAELEMERLDIESGQVEIHADKYSTVKRGLKSRHIQFIAIGFAVFFGEFNGANFVAAYIGLLIYFVSMARWWVWKRSGLVPYAEMDFVTGKAEIDAEELDYR